jgi:hypothetical protein
MSADERRVAKMLFGSDDVVVHQVNIAWDALVDLVRSAEAAARNAALDEAVTAIVRAPGTLMALKSEAIASIRALQRAPVPEPAPAGH